VRSRRPSARDDLVAADEDVLCLHAQIRKCRPVDPEELLDAFLARLEPGQFLVLDEVLCDVLAEPVDISRGAAARRATPGRA
jgi:hypothetical protein